MENGSWRWQGCPLYLERRHNISLGTELLRAEFSQSTTRAVRETPYSRLMDLNTTLGYTSCVAANGRKAAVDNKR